MNYRQPFILFKKSLKSGSRIWYYVIYDANGKRRQFSCGTKFKYQALQYCLDLYKKDAFKIKKASLTFQEYTKDWSIFDKCPYIKERMSRGYVITRNYADRRRKELEAYALPFLGKTRIDEINKTLLSNWINYLKNERGLSNSTTNKIVKGIKFLLTYAYNKGDIPTDIAKSVQLLKNDSSSRGTFEKVEIQKMFANDALTKLWNNDILQYVIHLTASKTGMRCGEIQGLQKENVFPDHILVEHTWLAQYGLKDTKTHKSREIPISQELYHYIKKIMDTQTKGNYVFSLRYGTAPISSTCINKKLKLILRKIGIEEEQQQKRRLSFHSYRHYVNTLLITSGIPKSIVQSIIGHVGDDAMTEHYTHISLEDEKQVLKII